MELVLGDVTLKGPSATETVTAYKPTEKGEEADATIYQVTGPEVDLTLHDILFADGGRQVIAVRRNSSSERFDRLIGRMRLTIGSGTDKVITLRQARMKGGGWANLFTATPRQLDKGSGLDVGAALFAAGASAYGTKADTLGETGRTRGQMCTTYRDSDGHLVPLVAFVATRVLPIMRRFPEMGK